MSTSYPGTIQSFVNPVGTNTLDDPDHAGLHSDVADTIEAIQAVIGTTAGTSVLKDFSAGEFPVRQEGGTVSPGTLTINDAILGSPTLTSGTINSAVINSPTLGSTPVLDATSAIPFYGDSMSRQAIINGNFDVWQRGTSIVNTTANSYTADRWYCETATAGTDKTVSREDGTGVNGSYYCARVKMVSDVDELLTFSQALESQDSIKFRGQKVTLSFYARGGAEFVADNATLVSKIVTGKGTDQKVLAFTTLADGVAQNNTLTTSWQKFTCTTTNVIASDITQIGVSFSFTHAGSGTTTNYFEVTQVQLCAGDVALPFMPKSYEEELRACQRYYEKSNYNIGWWFHALDVNTFYNHGYVKFSVEKRITPTVVMTGYNSKTTNSVDIQFTSTAKSVTYQYKGLDFFMVEGVSSNLEANKGYIGYWTADAEL